MKKKEEKRCVCCNNLIVKPKTSQKYCVNCKLGKYKLLTKDWRKKNLDYAKNYSRKYYFQNKDWFIKYRQLHKTYLNQRERERRHKNKNWNYIRQAKKHGLTIEEYKKITKNCVICGFSEAVDLHHDRTNGKPELVGLCPSHHQELHRSKTSFNQLKQKYLSQNEIVLAEPIIPTCFVIEPKNLSNIKVFEGLL